MTQQEYPKDKFGTESVVTLDANGSSEEIREEVYNGGVTRKLRISNDSIQIDNEQEIVAKVFELYKSQKEGSILGFLVDASKYNPKTLKISRMVVSTTRLA